MDKQTITTEFNRTIEEGKKYFWEIFEFVSTLDPKSCTPSSASIGKDFGDHASLSFLSYDDKHDSFGVLAHGYKTFRTFYIQMNENSLTFYADKTEPTLLSKFKNIEKRLNHVMAISYSFQKRIWTFTFTNQNDFVKDTSSFSDDWLLDDCVTSKIINQKTQVYSYHKFDSTSPMYYTVEIQD